MYNFLWLIVIVERGHENAREITETYLCDFKKVLVSEV